VSDFVEVCEIDLGSGEGEEDDEDDDEGREGART
jgi:hypothetical protein